MPNIIRLIGRLEARIFTRFLSPSFAAFGPGSIVMPPLRFEGESRIAIGSKVYIGRGSWIQTLSDREYDRKNQSRGGGIALCIGDRTSIAGACVLSAVRSVIIEEDVLFASNVYVSDHSHRYDIRGIPVKRQGIEKIAGVLIRKDAWIGQNAVICPGVTVGIGAVIGANSVVKDNVPDYCVVAGAPARIIKEIK